MMFSGRMRFFLSLMACLILAMTMQLTVVQSPAAARICLSIDQQEICTNPMAPAGPRAGADCGLKSLDTTPMPAAACFVPRLLAGESPAAATTPPGSPPSHLPWKPPRAGILL